MGLWYNDEVRYEAEVTLFLQWMHDLAPAGVKNASEGQSEPRGRSLAVFLESFPQGPGWRTTTAAVMAAQEVHTLQAAAAIQLDTLYLCLHKNFGRQPVGVRRNTPAVFPSPTILSTLTGGIELSMR